MAWVFLDARAFSKVVIFIFVTNAWFCSLKFDLALVPPPPWWANQMEWAWWLLTIASQFHFNYFFFRDCDLTLLKPLWQLFTHMENNSCQDMAKPGILLPLHRALAELFFVTENRVTVSSSCVSIPAFLSAGNDREFSVTPSAVFFYPSEQQKH